MQVSNSLKPTSIITSDELRKQWNKGSATIPGSKVLISWRHCKTCSTNATTVVNKLMTTCPLLHVPYVHVATSYTVNQIPVSLDFCNLTSNSSYTLPWLSWTKVNVQSWRHQRLATGSNSLQQPIFVQNYFNFSIPFSCRAMNIAKLNWIKLTKNELVLQSLFMQLVQYRTDMVMWKGLK